jgi:hypothetical protein
VRIPEISGASVQNTISFKAASSVSPQWSYNTATSANNYVLMLDSADFIHFEGIEFINVSSSVGRLIEISGGAHHNHFIKNTFSGQSVSSSSDNYALVYSSSGRDTANYFDSNIFRNGSYGIYLSGSGNHENNNQLINNQFTNQYEYAMYCSNQSELLIEHNQITTNSGTSIFIGIEVDQSGNDVKIIRNNIYYNSEGFCVLVNALNAEAGHEALIANNMLHAGGNTAAIGIFIESSNYLKLYNNNILISSPTIGSAGRAINIQDVNGRASHINIYNNIIVNKGLGFGLITFSTDSIYSDYNCFYTPYCPFGYWNGYNTNTMAIWLLYTNQDSHSIIHNPAYFSNNDLHVGNRHLDSAGLALPEITTDFDNEFRNSLYPDIGADEFIRVSLDAGITALLSPIAPCLNDSSTVVARVKNFGQDSIQSISLNWSLESIRQNSSPLLFPVQIAPGASVDITIGNYLTTQTEATEIELEITHVNQLADTVGNNNRIHKKIYTALSGNFQIGSNGDYQSLSQAIADLHLKGVCGPVVFMVNTGIYPEQLSINSIPGVSPTSTISFIGDKTITDSVLVTFTASQWYANYTLKSGSPWIHFEHINFVNDALTLGRVVDLVGETHGNSFRNCKFIGSVTSSTSPEYCLVYAADNISSDSLMHFDSNYFINGSYALWLAGIANTDLSSGNSITHNYFDNQYVSAILTSTQDHLTIQQNVINANTSYAAYTAISVQNSRSTYQLIGNKLNLEKARFGIHISATNGDYFHQGLIANNFIHIGGSYSNVRGISIDMSKHHKIYHNSVHIETNQYSSNALFINSNASDNWVYNNNLVNTGSGFALSYMGINALKSDYNNLYSTSSNFAFNNTNKMNLSAWQSATALDSHSVSTDPYFYSATDLHADAKELDSAGIQLQAITEDIDGDSRNPHFPDIGADEFVLNTYDAAINRCLTFEQEDCEGMKELQIEIQNHGVVPIDSLKIVYFINQQGIDSFTYYGPLAYREKDSFSLDSFSFLADSSYELRFQALHPNNQTDEDNLNNELIVNELNLLPRPNNLHTFDSLVCYNDSALLRASADNALRYFWFDDKTDGQLLHIGSNYKTERLKEDKTFFVEARSKAIPDSLATLFTTSQSNLTNGFMFDISATQNDIHIDSFDLHTQYEKKYPVWVYYRKGSYLGYENDLSAWIFLDSVYMQGLGQAKASRLPAGGFTIPKGEVYGVYITTIPVSYLNFSQLSNTYVDDDIAIWPGIALDYLFDARYAVTSTFNGRVYYSRGAYCKTERKAVTAFVKALPTIQLPSDTFICFQDSIELSANLGDAYSYRWRKLPSSDIISTREKIIIGAHGSYELKISDDCGHSVTDTIRVALAYNPSADYILNDSSQCLNKNNFQFTNLSFSILDTMFFLWDFGNGDTSHSKHISYSYAVDDSFAVKLKVTTDKGCSDSITRNVFVRPQPEADFEIIAESYCLNENLFHFRNKSTIPYGKINSSWDIAPDFTSIADSVSNYHFNGLGDYDIRLISTSNYGCRDTIEKSLEILENPHIELGNDTSLCADQHIVLMPGFGFDSYIWSNDSTDAAILVDSSGLGLGEFLYWVKVTEGECSSTDSIRITFRQCNAIQSMEDAVFSLYPNPATQQIHINIQEGRLHNGEQMKIIFYDIEGKERKAKRIEITAGKQVYSMDISDLNAGFYLVKIESPAHAWIQQVFIYK